MTPKISIQIKVALVFLLVGSISFVVSLFAFQTLNIFLNSSSSVINNQNSINTTSQETILALEEANSALHDGIDIANPNDIEGLRTAEARFSNASTRFDMFINALIWGSESDAFKKANGGISYSEWTRQKLNRTIVLAPLEPNLAQIAGQVDLFFGSFTRNGLALFALKRKSFRVTGQELLTTQQEIANLSKNSTDLRQNIASLTTTLVNETNLSLHQKILAEQAKLTTISQLIILLGIAGLLINIVGGILFSRYVFVKPIQNITKAVMAITSGNLNMHIPVYSSDELGILSTSFNLMVKDLQKTIIQLHDEEIKLEASINSLSLGFIMVDQNHNILTINQTARQYFCASPDSALATIPNCTLVHIEDELKGVIDLRSYITKCFNEKKAITIKELKFGDRFLKIIITPIITIGVIGAVILVDNITEAKVLERSKEEFFSIASHELRTPLTAIRGNTSMIKEFYSEKIKDPELMEMIHDIHESSVRLIEIVNDFLDTSRLELGKMEFKKENFNVVELMHETVKEFIAAGTNKNLALTIEDPTTPVPLVVADRNKVKQVLINLVGNALKFTEAGEVRLKVLQQANLIKLLVTDSGKGISPESQKLLFRKFQQAQDNLLTRDTTKGTGLGLYISRLMMQGMNGQVVIESSEIGKGTTFSVSIPVATESASTQPQIQPVQQVQSVSSLLH